MQRKIKAFRWIRVAGYLLLLLFFAVLPYSTVENGFFVCPSAAVGLQCPGCGATRAMTLLMKGQISEAFALNAVFTAVLFPSVLAVALQDTAITVLGRRMSYLEYVAGWNGSDLGGK